MIYRLDRPSGRMRFFALIAATLFALVMGNATAMADTAQSTEITVASTGNGSYVCSPAGFGQKSRCYRR